MTGDKNILAFANRNSLQHKSSRAYGAGSICIKDGLFYEANEDIAENTSFAEGDTGSTWKLVGSKPIEDWEPLTDYKVNDPVYYESNLWRCTTTHTSTTTFVESNWELIGSKGTESWASGKAYKIGDQVFAKQAVWEATSDHTSGGTFTNTNWQLKSGLINGSEWAVNSNGNITPLDDSARSIGSVANKMASVRSNAFPVYDGANWKGTLTGDANTIRLYSANDATEIRLGVGSPVDFTISDFAIYTKKRLIVESAFFSRTDLKIEPTNGNKNTRMESASDGGKVITDGPNLYLGSSGGSDWFISGGGDLRPLGFGIRSLGSSSNRVDTIWATNGTINTSDERLKDFCDFPEELLNVWLDYVKPKAYKWKESKNKNTQCGVSAQDVVRAFLAAGLDWTKFSIVEFDRENHKNFDITDIENLPTLSVRYDHVQVVEMAAIRKKLGL